MRDVPFIALTATATPSVRETILKDLTMKDCVKVIGDPNKPNIRYTVVDTDPLDLYGPFHHIIDDIRENNIKASNVLIFCRRKEHVKDLYELFIEHLGPQAYHRPSGEEPADDRSRIFAMYHKKTHKLVKSTIENEFCKEDGTVRVVFCTIAFGMGVNVKGAHIVIHMGPSGDLDDYLQESGRIGRTDNQMSHAVLLRYKGCTRSKNITKQMKNYVTNESECRRTLLLRPFSCNPQSDTSSEKHCCCDVCAESCRCLCSCNMNNFECTNPCPKQLYQSTAETAIRKLHAGKNSENVESTEIVNVITEEQHALLHDRLIAYRSELANHYSHEKLLTGLDYATGYSSVLVSNILENAKYLKSFQYLKDKFSFYNEEHAIQTWGIICEVLQLVTDEDSETINLPATIEDQDDNNVYDSLSDCDSDHSDIVERTVKLQVVSSSDEDDTCSE